MSLRERPPWPGDEVNGNVWGLMSPYARKKAGAERVCRLCARGGMPNNRFSWHPKCRGIAGAGLDWCLRRQRGFCASCPTRLAEFRNDHWTQWLPRNVVPPGVISWRDRHYPEAELDHRVPLWQVSLMSPPRDRLLRWWLPGNLQALCVECHRAKTSQEARHRAILRRSQDALLPEAR